MEILNHIDIMQISARELAEILHGDVEGNPDVVVKTFAKIEHGRPGALSFYANPKYEKYVYESRSDILLVNRDFVPQKPVKPTLVKVDDAYFALAEILGYVASQRKKYRRHRGRCRIACSARIGRRVWVGDFVKIGARSRVGDFTKIYDNVTIGHNVTIGSRCIIYPGVTIFADTVIGDRTILHSGCVIGDDGFGNAPQEDGTWKKIEHCGNVIIGKDVEIGSNTTVDKAPMESTIIGNGVRIDNLCQIAHNVIVGDNTVMAAQTGIAGSTQIGRNCIFAGQVGLAGHLKVADRTTLCAQSGLIGNVRGEGEVLIGTPAIPRNVFMRAYVKFKSSGEE